MQLAPCPSCRRHVQVNEAACPFCASPLANLPQRSWLAPTARLGRAALLAVGAAAAQGCGDNVVMRAPVDAPVDVSPPDDGGAVPLYAAAPTPDAGPAGTKQG